MKINGYRLLLAAFAVLLCGISMRYLYLGYRYYAGYCARTEAKISDDRKIDLAIALLLTYYPKDQGALNDYLHPLGHPSTDRNPSQYYPVPYAGVEDFKQINRDCCDVLDQPRGSGTLRAGWFDRMMGTKVSFVEIKYKLRYKTATGKDMEQRREVTYAITNCGIAWSGI